MRRSWDFMCVKVSRANQLCHEGSLRLKRRENDVYIAVAVFRVKTGEVELMNHQLWQM